MDQPAPLTRPRLTTLRAGAAAGILFGILYLTFFSLIRSAVPASPTESGAWLATSGNTVVFALNLVPFAGIAFLWFIGVVRERLGSLEDRFFATVFLGSGLLFLAMLFASAAVAGGLIAAYATAPDPTGETLTWTAARAVIYQIMNVYVAKMAGVFMISTSTIARRSRIIPRWMVLFGYILALFLLLSSGVVTWVTVLFPLWVLVVSVQLFVEDLRRPSGSAATGVEAGNLT
jgi:hypothetical protein